jgi:rhodanese-related sulfurtransferase
VSHTSTDQKEKIWPVPVSASSCDIKKAKKGVADMKKRIFIIPILLAIGPFIINANAGSSYDIYKATLIEPNEKTPNISTDELRRILEEKNATVFDARSPKEYAIDHIPGAVNVRGKPGGAKAGGKYVSEVEAIAHHVQNDKAADIVVYCSGTY